MLLIFSLIAIIWFYVRIVRTFILRYKEHQRLENAFGYDPDTRVLKDVGDPRCKLVNSDTIVLMLPGMGCFPSRFDPLIEHLDQHDVSYIAPRHPYYAKQEFPRELPYTTNDHVAAFFDQVFKFIRPNYKNVILVTHSAGSTIASWLMNRYTVEGCIMLAPNIVEVEKRKWIKQLIMHPIGQWFMYLVVGLTGHSKLYNNPSLCDTVNKGHYYSNQWASIHTMTRARSMWEFQDMKCGVWNVPNVLFWFGALDTTNSSPQIQKKEITRRCKKYVINIAEGCAHNILQEECIDEVIHSILSYIKDPINYE